MSQRDQQSERAASAADVFDAPWEWDFFQALRQIECAFPDSARLGTSDTLRDDPARFGQFISLAFATSTLERRHAETVQPRDLFDDSPPPPPKLLIRFTGLTGPQGPLPLVLTEFIRNRLTGVDDPDLPRTTFGEGADQPQAARRDPVLAEFIDLFHHRLICLFYRAWAVANQTVDFDRSHLPGASTSFAEWLASLFGHGLPEFDGLDSIPTWQKVAFTGHFANPTRHLSGLRGVVGAAFATGSEVEPLVGQWVNIPEGESCRLGERPGTGTLGVNCLVGSRFWDRQMKFNVRLGPMPYAEFITFLPGEKNHRRLHDWINLYTRQEFDWEAAIVLRRDEVPPLRLGRGAQLGRTGWVHSRPFALDPEDYHVNS
ncbi:MAG TPA: type VI secretion system baseplate subunit TssG [Chthoniobacteraceae bacterium]|jgi:type VI secretion system protein ImpH|nr:type VI secretion system baseplate subunit TssG [Chthoniobacteraceae bacterium]